MLMNFFPVIPPLPALALRVLFRGRPWRILALAATSLALFPHPAFARSPIFYESEPIVREIDRIGEIISSLPMNSTNSSPWTLGYASSWDDLPEAPLIIEIQFKQSETIDLVAMLPAAYTAADNTKQSFGFPLRFSLERLLPDGSVEMIANHLETDYPESGMGPQLFPCANPVPTRGLRITVTRRARNPTWWATSHVVALSEVFAFAGDRNVALHGEVTTSSSYNLYDVWSPDCLTDGFSLYSPIHHDLNDPTKSFRGPGDQVRLEMDLGREHRIDEFRLWPVVRTIQHNYPLMIGVGFPQAIRLELATTPDFSDARVVYEQTHLTQQPGGGPWTQQFNPTPGRYVRITLMDGLRNFRSKDQVEINLGEIELLEDGRLVSGGLPVLAPGAETVTTGLALLTDSLVSEGRILPLRQWLTQFYQRVALTQQLRGLWRASETARSRDEKRLMAWLFIGIGVILAMAQMVWLVRVAAHRRAAKMRERIACDLHDEIGANVSSIAHTAELLKETIREPSTTQSRLLVNLIESAQLTTKETKHFIRFIESEEQDGDLTEQFAQVSNRILGTIPSRFSLENTRSFNALDPSTKWNLLLFYKEALNNIIKHAAATVVEVRTCRAGSKLLLEITDNGRGMPDGSAKCRRLESRAKVLGGHFEVSSSPGDGTRVILTFSRNYKS